MKKQSNILVRLLGLLICLAATWLGSYLVHSLPINDWARFPVFMSAVSFFVTGFVMVVLGKES